MKKMKRFFATALGCLLALGGLGMTACGEDDPKTITVGFLNNAPEEANMTRLRNAFEKKYEAEGYRVNFYYIHGDYHQVVLTDTLANMLPDVICVPDDTSAYWTNRGIYANLDEYIERDNIDLSLYVDSMIDIARSGQDDDDSLYWLPRAYDKLVTYVNTDVFETAGIAVPTAEEWTWAKMKEVAGQLKNKTQDIIDASKEDPDTEIRDFVPMTIDPSWAPVYTTMFKNYGVKLASNGKPFDGQQANIDACIQELYSLYENGLVMTGKDVDITHGEIGFMVGGVRPGVPNYEDSGINYAVLPFPTEINGNSYVACGTAGYTMTTSCPENKREIAWKFLSYMFSEEGQQAFSKTGLLCPVMKSLLADENAEWQKASSVDDTAFYANPERDFKATFLQNYKPLDPHPMIYKAYTNMFKNLYAENFGGKGSLSAFYTYYSGLIQQELNRK